MASFYTNTFLWIFKFVIKIRTPEITHPLTRSYSHVYTHAQNVVANIKKMQSLTSPRMMKCLWLSHLCVTYALFGIYPKHISLTQKQQQLRVCVMESQAACVPANPSDNSTGSK